MCFLQQLILDVLNEAGLSVSSSFLYYRLRSIKQLAACSQVLSSAHKESLVLTKTLVLMGSASVESVCVVYKIQILIRCLYFITLRASLFSVCACSVPDLGELLQCALGHEDSGYLHSRETPCSRAHHSRRTRPNL